MNKSIRILKEVEKETNVICMLFYIEKKVSLESSLPF